MAALASSLINWTAPWKFCLAALIGAVVVGIYATAHKPKAKPAKPTKSAEVASPAPALR